jgi:hypothetical protein
VIKIRNVLKWIQSQDVRKEERAKILMKTWRRKGYKIDGDKNELYNFHPKSWIFPWQLIVEDNVVAVH